MRDTEPVGLRIEAFEGASRARFGAQEQRGAGEGTGSGGAAGRELDVPARTGLDVPPSGDDGAETDRPAKTRLLPPPSATEDSRDEP